MKKFEAFNQEDLKNHNFFLKKLMKDYSPSDSPLNEEDIRNKIKTMPWYALDLVRFERNATPPYLLFQLPESLQKAYDILGVKNKYSMKIEIDSFGERNRTHFYHLDRALQGLGLGYKIYKNAVHQLGYISSNSNASSDAQKVWSYLIQDPDFYSIMTSDEVMVLSKKAKKETIKSGIINFLREYVDPNIGYDLDDNNIQDYLKAKLTIKVDPQLSKDFREFNFHKLNVDLYDRYHKIFKK